MMTAKISVTILVKNSSRYLHEVLHALSHFDEILVCDTGSTDNTLSIAKSFPNVTLIERPFIGFGPTHNVASNLAKNDWILSIDSDEVVNPDLAKEILELNLVRNTVYALPRDNEYKGKAIRWCGWYPDYQIRLYNRQDTRYNDALVHESIVSKGLKIVKLKNALKHYSYNNVSEFLGKMQSYTDLFAKQNQGKKSGSMAKAIGHGFFAFFKSYIVKRGFMGGSEGFEISVYNANTAFYKYLKLAEINRKK